MLAIIVENLLWWNACCVGVSESLIYISGLRGSNEWARVALGFKLQYFFAFQVLSRDVVTEQVVPAAVDLNAAEQLVEQLQIVDQPLCVDV